MCVVSSTLVYKYFFKDTQNMNSQSKSTTKKQLDNRTEVFN